MYDVRRIWPGTEGELRKEIGPPDQPPPGLCPATAQEFSKGLSKELTWYEIRTFLHNGEKLNLSLFGFRDGTGVAVTRGKSVFWTFGKKPITRRRVE